jgi:hypothetical protein
MPPRRVRYDRGHHRPQTTGQGSLDQATSKRATAPQAPQHILTYANKSLSLHQGSMQSATHDGQLARLLELVV